MRIAFFVNVFPWLSETFILNQITGLIDRGHDVNIYALSPGDSQMIHGDVKRYRLEERVRYMHKIPSNYIIRLLNAVSLIGNNIRKLRPMVLLRSMNIMIYGRDAASLRLFYDSVPFLRQKQYDIIHCQFGTLGPMAMRLKQIGAISGKLVTSLRGYDTAQNYLQKQSGIYDKLFRAGDLFLPVSEFIKRQLIKEGCEESKIIVHYSGVDCGKFDFSERRRAEGEPVKVLTIARLVEKKGVEYGIRAVAKLINRCQNMAYSIIGDGFLRENLVELIQKLQVGNNVRLLGWKRHEEIIQFLKSSDILMAPSITAKNGDKEGIPNVIKEAMAVGLPVVSTQHSGIPELVQDAISGFLVPERDTDLLAEKLLYLVENQEMRSKMGRAGSEYVRAHYDINKLNDRLVEIYQDAIKKKPEYVYFK